MRTTIEISDTHRAALLKLAAERREKGFSRLIADAIEAYLSRLAVSDRGAALKMRGRFSQKDAEALRARAKAIRDHWR
jgi:hypothetical protein